MICKLQNSALIVLLFCVIPHTCHGQDFRDRAEKLSPSELEEYQECTTDDECITVTNGICDCANGGQDVAINANRLDSFNKIFGDKVGICTMMLPLIPCGVGAGNTCVNNLCKFNACRDPMEALECLSTQNETDARLSCMKETCKAKPDIIEENSAVSEIPDTPPENVEVIQDHFSLYNLESGKLLGQELEAFQSCDTDDDCIYINNGFCDCANGGEEVAVNKNKYDEFKMIFNSTLLPCTRRGRPLPCGIGAGVKCHRRKKLCTFNPCLSQQNALECTYLGEETDILSCMETECATRTFLRPFN